MHGLANARVLVVEEEVSIKILRKFRVGTAKSNMEAIRMVEQQQFPVVVIDPGESGQPAAVAEAVEELHKALTGARAAIKVAREVIENTSVEGLDN